MNLSTLVMWVFLVIIVDICADANTVFTPYIICVGHRWALLSITDFKLSLSALILLNDVLSSFISSSYLFEMYFNSFRGRIFILKIRMLQFSIWLFFLKKYRLKLLCGICSDGEI